MTVDQKFDVTETGTVEVQVLDLSAFRARRVAEEDPVAHLTAQAPREASDSRYLVCRDHILNALKALVCNGMRSEEVAVAAVATAGFALRTAVEAGEVRRDKADEYVDRMRAYVRGEDK